MKKEVSLVASQTIAQLLSHKSILVYVGTTFCIFSIPFQYIKHVLKGQILIKLIIFTVLSGVFLSKTGLIFIFFLNM